MSSSGKSLLATINTGFKDPETPKLIVHKIPLAIPIETPAISQLQPTTKLVSGLLTTIKTGYDSNRIETILVYLPEENSDVETTFSTGFNHNDKPVVPENLPETLVGPASFPESVKNTVQTGYGKDNKLHKVCKPPRFITYLAKEEYLGEFREETEKTLARNNLGVYSSKEVDNLVSSRITGLSNNFVTKEEFNQEIEAAKTGIDSTLKSYALYQIPESLFKL